MRACLAIPLICGLLHAQSPKLDRDSAFVEAASAGAKGELQLAQLAEQKAANEMVKDLAKRVLTDEMNLQADLAELAAENGMALAQSQNAKDRALQDTLSSLSGPLFDSAFVNALMGNYRDAIQQFQKEADTGRNEKVKAFAARTLPVLREHLRLAEDAGSKLGFNSNQTGGR